MKKLRLDLDALAVETFETHAAAGLGTVMAAAEFAGAGAIDGVVAQTYPNCSAIDACPSAWNCTLNGTCYDPTCVQANTCAKTCAATCPASCAPTCWQSCYQPACSGPVCQA